MVAIVQKDDAISWRNKLIIIIFLSLVALLTVLDVVEDTIEGSSFVHCASEISIILGCLVVAITIWRQSINDVRQSNENLRVELLETRKDLEKWREKTAELSSNLHNAISQQLEEWKLSPAELDVAFMLLNGLSIKEIAVTRNTSERTVRQQTACIYKKSNLEGRAHLAAFFLEDILSIDKK